MTERKRCSTCEWFVPADEEPDTARGVCKRYPPTIMYMPRAVKNLANETLMTAQMLGGAWPYVLPVHFCGEHKAVPYSAILKS